MQDQSVNDLIAGLRQIRETNGEEAYTQAWKALSQNERNRVLNSLGQGKTRYSVGVIGIIPFAIGLGLFVLSIKLAIVDSVVGGYDWTAFVWGAVAGLLMMTGALVAVSDLLSRIRSELRARIV